MRYRYVAALLPLLLSACSYGIPEEVTSLPAPDDPHSAVKTLVPSDYFRGYVDRKPVQPAPWRSRTDDDGRGGAR